jgi:hypothetical protein
MLSTCGNCDWKGQPDIELTEIPDLNQRLEPGSTVPSGECPKCAALCYPLSFHLIGKRWFNGREGNTYHTVRIYTKDRSELVAACGLTYGYDDCYIQTAIDKLKELKLIPADAHYGTRYLREELGSTYEVHDVNRKKDL